MAPYVNLLELQLDLGDNWSVKVEVEDPNVFFKPLQCYLLICGSVVGQHGDGLG